MPESPTQEPPSLIQESENTKKVLLMPQPKTTTKSFNTSKVFAAVGLILISSLLIISAFWIWIQSLENRINELEESVTVTKVASQSAKQVTTSATQSAQ